MIDSSGQNTMLKRKTYNSSQKSMNSSGIEKGFTFKDAKDLELEYNKVVEIITINTGEGLSQYLNNTDIKYYLINNDLDYSLFILCLKQKNTEYLE